MSGVEEGEFVWIRVAAVPKEGAPAPKPAEREGDPFVPDWAKFAQRTSGWEYQLPAWKADTLRRLREAPKADAGADAVPPAQAVPPATAPTAP
jgi:hypothetical protein